MQVLHLAPGNLYGGIETLLVTLARHRSLCPRMEPHFALCFEGRLSGELRDAGVPVQMVGTARVRRPWTIWQARRRFRVLLATEKPDLVVCHGSWAHAMFGRAARAYGVPLVFWAHGFLAGRHWLERWAKRTRPDLVIANSRATQATVPNVFPGVPSELLYYPVPAVRVPDRERNRREIRAAFHTPDDAVVIALAGRLERWKGQTLLLQALGQLSQVPGWTCWMIGGPQRPMEQQYLRELEDTAGRLGIRERVLFLGQRTDVPRLLAAADIHCQPNLGPEPFGIAFVEALYAHLPVVTTAMGGALEIVDDRCGVLVPPGDPAALSAALSRLIRDASLRSRLGNEGPTRAQDLCQPERQINALLETLARACESPDVSCSVGGRC